MSDRDPRIAPPPPRSAPVGDPSEGFTLRPARAALEIAVILASFLLVAGLLFAFAGRLAAGLLPLIPMSVDRKLGEVIFASVVEGERSCSDAGAKAYVLAIAEPLEKALGPTEYPFEYLVLDTDVANAFALPGGFIVVNRGLIEKAEDGSEVAGVLAHELQHVVLRHSTSRALWQSSAALLFQFFFFGSGLGTPAQVYSFLTNTAFTRDQESAADREGARLLVRAKIDPRAQARYLKRLAAEGPEVPVWLSSHPLSGDRAAALEAFRVQGAPLTLPSPQEFRCRSGS